MMKIAALGPKGTYCDIACQNYLNENNLDYEIVYYPSILKIALSISENDFAVLPFENTLDGFVMESLDQIINSNLHIIKQLKLNIDFAFVTNAKSIDDVEKCYVQFKAYGQCLDFISNNRFSISQTQSNTQSLERLLEANDKCGAIIPVHLLENNSFNLVINHIADSTHNETRFFVISKENIQNEIYDIANISIVITAIEDRSGILFDILKEFHYLDINLKAIMSRPMKTEMGKYKFYIECSLDKNNLDKLDKLIKQLETQNHFKVNLLGAYNEI